MNRSTGAATILLVTFLAAAALAQDAVPDLKGTWKGTGKIMLFGTTEHLIGSPQNAVVRNLPVTHTVTGQDGRLLWGTTSSANNDSKEPFASALSADNKTILGADTDATIGSPSCRPIGSRNATRRAEQALGTQLSPRVS
jgi:hypothetical protein